MINKSVYVYLCLSIIYLFNGNCTAQKDEKKNDAALENLVLELEEISNKKTIEDNDVLKAYGIINILSTNSLYHTTLPPSERPSRGFAKICVKNNRSIGVNKYIEFMLTQKGSADEMLSTDFEELFKNNPVFVINKIRKLNNSDQDYIFSHWIWGYFHNRCNLENTKGNELKFDKQDYKDYFFNIYPVLKINQDEYKNEMNKMLELILNWLDDYY